MLADPVERRPNVFFETALWLARLYDIASSPPSFKVVMSGALIQFLPAVSVFAIEATHGSDCALDEGDLAGSSLEELDVTYHLPADL